MPYKNVPLPFTFLDKGPEGVFGRPRSSVTCDVCKLRSVTDKGPEGVFGRPRSSVTCDVCKLRSVTDKGPEGVFGRPGPP